MTQSSLLPPVTNLQALPAVAAQGTNKLRRYPWALLALTALSGLLCFNRLSVSPPRIDECFTYWRVCGNLDQLLDTLRNDAFMPLHYELLNWIGQGFPLGGGVHLVPGGIMLTPAALRFFPALCGTLMTPVMYFLARQMFTRRTALIAAAFIACSAYGLFFSRDAKMYAPAWMLETLTIACLLWWIRTWRRIAWLCWIAAGIAAGGFHVITLLLLPLAPLYFISMGRFSGWRIPSLVIGMAMIALGPAVYHGVFNRWTQNTGGLLPGVVGEPAPDAKWRLSGLNWIQPADDSVGLPFEALNNYLSGYDWSTFSDLADPPPLLKRFGGTMIALAGVTYGLLIFGALPWPHHRRCRVDDARPEQWWRALLWLMLWLVLPVYGFFYCRSVDNFSSPVVWLTWLSDVIGPHRLVAALGAVAIAAGLNRWPRVAKFIAVPLHLLAVAAVIQTARNRLDWVDYAGFPVTRIALAMFIPALLFHYAGSSFRERGRQLLRLVAVVAVVLALCEAAAHLWPWLHDVSMRKHPELPWQSIWHIRYVAIVLPAVWLAAAALIARLPNRFVRVAAVLMICSYNLANGLARQYIQQEIPLDRAMADMFQSQPHSDVRTYFELHALMDNIFYRPLASYSACMVAGLRPTPAEFRTGNTWPFQWGRVAAEFKNHCIYNPSISSEQLRHDIAASPQVTRVIVWEIDAWPRLSVWPIGEVAADGLGDGWVLASDERIVAHSYWTWRDEWVLRRREFHRKS
ncbi:MAG: glycosyltransferase family 39 protein [Tepidisphaeraceae bacterium]